MSLREYYKSLTHFNDKREKLIVNINSLKTSYSPSLEDVIKNAMMDSIYTSLEVCITPSISECLMKFIIETLRKEGLNCSMSTAILVEINDNTKLDNECIKENHSVLHIDWNH